MKNLSDLLMEAEDQLRRRTVKKSFDKIGSYPESEINDRVFIDLDNILESFSIYLEEELG